MNSNDISSLNDLFPLDFGLREREMRQKLFLVGYILIAAVLLVVARSYFQEPEEKLFIPDPKIDNNFYPNAMDYYMGDIPIERFDLPTYPKLPSKLLLSGRTAACSIPGRASSSNGVAFVSQSQAKALANLSSSYVYVLENLCYFVKQEIRLQDEWGKEFAKASVRAVIHRPQISGSRVAYIHNLMALHRLRISESDSGAKPDSPDLAMIQIEVNTKSIHPEFTKPLTALPSHNIAVPTKSLKEAFSLINSGAFGLVVLKTHNNPNYKSPLDRHAQLVNFKNESGFLIISNRNRLNLSKQSTVLVYGKHANDYSPLRAAKFLYPLGIQQIYWVQNPLP